jgi:hypothetical protein
MNRLRRALAFGLAGAALAARAPAVLALEAPRGPVVLTVSGRVALPNGGPRAVFDMAMLEQMPQSSFTTKTPWYAQPRKFTGPLLRDVLAAAGAQGQTLRAVALNDYRVDIPIGDVQRYDVVLARLLDGQPMSVREKGPLFIMYPFDRQPELRNAVYFSRCVWQLKSLDVT